METPPKPVVLDWYCPSTPPTLTLPVDPERLNLRSPLLQILLTTNSGGKDTYCTTGYYNCREGVFLIRGFEDYWDPLPMEHMVAWAYAPTFRAPSKDRIKPVSIPLRPLTSSG